jgi:hypothetical protein
MSLSIFEFGDGRFRLFRGDQEVGWLEGRTVAFLGFANAAAARRAAHVAYDAMSAWLARQRRTGASPRRGRPLESRTADGNHVLTLGGIAIGRLCSDAETHGFELQLPPGISSPLTVAQVIDDALKRHQEFTDLQLSALTVPL